MRLIALLLCLICLAAPVTAQTIPPAAVEITLPDGTKLRIDMNFTILDNQPPPAGKIQDTQNAAGEWNRSFLAGDKIQVIGTGFGTGFGTVKGTVQIAGLTFPADTWTDTRVVATIPPVIAHLIAGPVSLIVGPVTIRGEFDVSVNPLPPPPTGGPVITAYTDSIGQPVLLPQPGTPIHITGTGFGTSGQILFSGIPLPVAEWTDTRITLALPDATAYPSFFVLPDAGGYYGGVAFRPETQTLQAAIDGVLDAIALTADRQTAERLIAALTALVKARGE